MRVLYIHHLGVLGGASTSLLMLLREIAKRETVHCRVLCAKGPYAEKLRAEGFEVHTIPISGFYHLPGNTYRGFRWLLFLRELGLLVPHIVALMRHLRAFKPDLVHLNEAVLIPAALTCKFLHIPVVWHARIVLDCCQRGIRRNMILKTMQYAAQKVIAISDDVRSDLVGVSAITVHNSVDLNRFNNRNQVESSRKLSGLNPWDKTVTMVSRIDPIKGSYDFVKIAYLVKQSIPNVKFIVAGGALRDKKYFKTIKGRIIKYLKLLEDRESIFKSQIATYGLESDFLLLGEISNIEQIYSASDVIVFPSYLRSISRAALEAAAAGIPSIATTTTWNNDVIVHGKTGFLVPQGDVRAAAAAISKILKDPGLQAEMGRNAWRHALKFFDPEKNAEKVYALYRALLYLSPSAQYRRKS